MIRYFRYVRYSDLLWRLAQGWHPVADLGNTHGQWALLCEWSGTGEPKNEEGGPKPPLTTTIGSQHALKISKQLLKRDPRMRRGVEPLGPARFNTLKERTLLPTPAVF